MLDFSKSRWRAQKHDTGSSRRKLQIAIAAGARPGNFDISALADAAFRAWNAGDSSGENAYGRGTKNRRGCGPVCSPLGSYFSQGDVAGHRDVSLLLKRAELCSERGFSCALEKALPGFNGESLQRQRYARSNSASARSAGHLRTQSRRMAVFGSAWKAACAEGISNGSGAAVWRSQRHVGIAWRQWDSSCRHVERRAWLWGGSHNALAHSA